MNVMLSSVQTVKVFTMLCEVCLILLEMLLEITGKGLDWKSNLGSGLIYLTSPYPRLCHFGQVT